MEMRICEACGGILVCLDSENSYKCKYCGNEYFLKERKGEALIISLNRASGMRHCCDFDGAITEYEAILSSYPNDEEANWGMFISRCGIEYVKDDRTGNFIPSCHRTLQYDVFEDPYYKKAVKNASLEQARIYEDKVKEISRLQKRIKQQMDDEENFDVFISFKSKDANGYPTKEAVVARNIYEKLKSVGIKSFFSEVTLKDRIGDEYEPIIYKALYSCKYFILVTTSIDNTNAVWVKNEWSRFRDRMKDENMTKCAFAVFEGRDCIPTFLRGTQGFDLSHYPNGGYEIDVADFLLLSLGRVKKERDTDIIKAQLEEEREQRKKQEEEHNRQMEEMKLLISSFANQSNNRSEISNENKTKDDADLAELKALLEADEDDEDYGTSSLSSSAQRSFSQPMTPPQSPPPPPTNNYYSNNASGSGQFLGGGMAPRNTSGASKKIPKVLIIIGISLVLIFGGTFGIITGINNSKVDKVEALISELPTDENYYLDYQAEIVDAYAAYMELDEKLRDKVENSDVLLSIMDGLKVAEAYEQRQNMQFTELESGGYSVKLKEGANSKISGELVIPEVYRQQPVVAIEDYAFEKCRTVTSVVVPDSVTTIGLGAFKGCNSLQSISIPFTGNKIDATDDKAVFGYIFGYDTRCSDDDYNTFSNAFVNTQIGSIDGAVWQYSSYNGGPKVGYDKDVLQSYFYYIPTSLKEIIITNQSEIKVAAFNGCNQIVSVKYKQTLTDIEDASFQNCENLKYLNTNLEGCLDLTGYCAVIGKNAFANCKKVQSYILGENITTIDDYAFDGCINIEKIHFTNMVGKIGNYAFRNLKLVTDLIIPNSVKNIELGAFKGCNSLQSISIPFTGNKIDATDDNAVFGYIFGYDTRCSDDDYNTFSNAFVNTQIGSIDGAVWQYSSYNGGPKVGYDKDVLQSYFYYIPTSLKEIIITNQSEIKVAAFNGCNQIVSVKYKQTLTGIEDASFQNCTALLKVNSDIDGVVDLSGKYTSIGKYAFSNCEGISNIVIPNGILNIRDFAFQNTAITEIIIPDSVQMIGSGVFKSCRYLQKMQTPFIGMASDETWDSAVFGAVFGYVVHYGDDYATFSRDFLNKKKEDIEGVIWQYSSYNGSPKVGYDAHYIQYYYYYIPMSLTEIIITKQTNIPTAAFNGCTMLEKITFTNGISSQGECAFQNCTATIIDGTE